MAVFSHGRSATCFLPYRNNLITIWLMNKRGSYTTQWLAIGVLSLAAIAVGPSCYAQTRPAVTWRPAQLTNGSPALFRVTAPAGVKSVEASWLGHQVSFFYGRHERSWFGLGGVPLQTAPGAYELRVTERFGNGRSREITRKVRIAKASYPSATIKVAKQFTEPSHAQLAAIAADKGVKQKTFSALSAERLWSGPFTAPVSAPISAVFGTGRVFNHEVQSRHEGLDYAVPGGTPVRAIGRGTVLLARPMFFEGNFVVVDHGQGLLSLYLHLSEFKVKEGETVSEGQVIGLSGGTGRATGAHLHLAVRWQGVYLNPVILLRLPIPAD
jgi:hypothetical protein